jgi:hypothetical protein
MCLNKIYKIKPKQIKYVYKVFEKFKDKYAGLYYGSSPYELNTWYEASKCKIKSLHGDMYKSGFHCFTNKKDAYSICHLYGYTVVKVEVLNITTIGKQRFFDEGNTIVCDKIKLIKELYYCNKSR